MIAVVFDKHDSDDPRVVVDALVTMTEFLTQISVKDCPYDVHASDCQCRGVAGDR